MSKFDEQILVIDREILFDNEKNSFNGYISNEDVRFNEIVNNFSKIEVKRRGDMEENPQYKQLIGYAIVKDKATKEILVYTRLTGGGESRLHGKASVGVGGHMNMVDDKSIEEIIKINISRELKEEIGVSFEENLDELVCVGLINDDTNEVGRVHMGLVYQVYVDKRKVKDIEEDTLRIDWLKSSNAKKLKNYESWSEFLKPII
ncbi:DNA mismatch repair protein MutT [Gemella sp. 19428wG2_WT2a]|nr:DNA mismatch repair protein MutT [Gemella sp. 19428wG2_WT2a]TFU60565.1 DNA mismatch repair protein MutT [Gemella sp. WT2a]